jgi:hypothetical protein
MDFPLVQDGEGNRNTIPPVPADKLKNVNCHKFVLYAIGALSWEDMISNPNVQKEAGLDYTFGEKLKGLSDIPFTLILDKQQLYALASGQCAIGQKCVGEILDTETKEMAHSFILEREDENTYTCFDKQGFKYPFNVCELGELLDFVNKDGVKAYQNQEWRFVKI